MSARLSSHAFSSARRVAAVLTTALVTVLMVAPVLSSCSMSWRRSEPVVASQPPVAPAPMVDTAPVAAAPADTGLPEQWHRSAFMQIDIRAYQDSDGDGVGDIKGLIRRLDHLEELGVRGLALMPWQPGSGEGRGDGLSDFRGVDPVLGTLADIDELLRQAHAKRIGVVLDYPLNHVGAGHPFFVDALRGPGSPYHDWFVWADEAPKGWDVRGRNPWHAAGRAGHYYGVFGAGRPDFDFVRQPKVLEHHLDNLRFWLNRGVDGFRLLGATHLVEHDSGRWYDQPESRKIGAVVAQLMQGYPKRVLVCDAPESAEAWAAICGMAIAPGVGPRVVQAARGDAAAVQALAERLRKLDGSSVTWLSSPDATAGGVRVGDEVGSDAAAYRLVAASYLLLPGRPFIHYGEEVGQEGSAVAAAGTSSASTITSTTNASTTNASTTNASTSPGSSGASSPALRGPMSWSDPNSGADGFSSRAQGLPPMAVNLATNHAANQRGVFGSVHSTYRDLLDLRQRRSSVARGTLENVFVRGQVLGFMRVQGDERTLVVINYGSRRLDVDVTGLPRRARVAPIYPRRAGASYVAQVGLADSAGRFEVDVPARSARVFDIEPPR